MDIEKRHNDTFESIRKTMPDGREYWSARELSKILEYVEFRNFLPVIEKAKRACENSGQKIEDHFVHIHEMVRIGSDAQREMPSYALSRYACYLVVQNADPSKPIIAQGQTYFAIQTRRQELADDEAFLQLNEDRKRLFLRNELREHNKQLVETAPKAGVEKSLDFAIFQNHGYKGLYGGMDAKDIHQHKKLGKSQQILDHMGSTELAANLFRATQAEEKIRKEQIKDKSGANQTHHDVGKEVRDTIRRLGGTMPEDLPTPQEGVRAIEKNRRKLEGIK